MPLQPSKLKFLLSRHLATNSFGLGRLFYKSIHQLQNFRHHGDQNGCNLKGCFRAKYTFVVITLQDSIYVTLRINLTDKLKVSSRFLCMWHKICYFTSPCISGQFFLLLPLVTQYKEKRKSFKGLLGSRSLVSRFLSQHEWLVLLLGSVVLFLNNLSGVKTL